MQENLKLLECLREIQPIAEKLLTKRESVTREFVSLFVKRDIKKIYFSGQASGIYVAMMLKRFIEDVLQIEVQITNPFEFNNFEKINVNGIYSADQLCLICPAHSGTTIGPIEMVERCQKVNVATVCTTIDMESPLAKKCDVSIYKYCGKEESYIETKTHFASMICLYMCLLDYGIVSKKIEKSKYNEYYNELKDVCSNLTSIIDKTINWHENNKKIFDGVELIRYVAYGEFEGAALEGGLKIAETTCIACVYYELEEFMHRSTTQIVNDSCIIILAGNEEMKNRVNDLVHWCQKYSSKTIVIDMHDNIIEANNRIYLRESNKKYFTAMGYVICLETLAYCISQDRNISVIECKNDGASATLHTHVA